MKDSKTIQKSTQSYGNNIKKSAWLALLESAATIVLGILLIAWPDAVVQVIAYIVGAFLIVKGAYQVINYFIIRGQNDFFNNNLLFGVISVLIGVALLLIGEEIMNVFRIVVGIWMVYESLVRISNAVKLYAAKISAWKYILILALMMLAVGIFVTFNQGAMVVLIGWMMILAGVIGIIGDVMLIQYINKVTDYITKKLKINK